MHDHQNQLLTIPVILLHGGHAGHQNQAHWGKELPCIGPRPDQFSASSSAPSFLWAIQTARSKKQLEQLAQAHVETSARPSWEVATAFRRNTPRIPQLEGVPWHPKNTRIGTSGFCKRGFGKVYLGHFMATFRFWASQVQLRCQDRRMQKAWNTAIQQPVCWSLSQK